ncbi:ABC transporter permease [Bosea sp. 2RAB26]|uniref:ABC transporter permease n=1 Tax=Bosea sp. 2RAB26 TaxID=3237476 RepID=UPI003F90953B
MWFASRILSSLAVLVVVSALLFALTRLTPLSPARIVLGTDATVEQIHEFERDRGLDRALPAQYAAWVAQLPHSGFGTSYITGRSIDLELRESLPVTVELVVATFLLTLVGAIPLGLVAGLTEDRWPDHLIRVLSLMAVSVPGFWLALILIRVFAVRLGWVPPIGITPLSEGWHAHLASLVLPALSIALYYIGALSRLMRASVIEILGQDYVRTAHALGLRRSLVARYVVKNALPPFVSVAGMSFGYMFGWAIIIELVFNIPGLSRALLTAITQRDYPMIQATVLVVTVMFILSNLAADLIQRLINPRLRHA